MYTNIVLFFVVTQALHDFKTSTLFVYMILNDKGGLNGCGLCGYSLASVLF